MAELLADHTTLRLGGPASAYVVARTTEELTEAVTAADAAGDVLVLGGGSNLVVADEGFAGTVVEVATTGVTTDHDSTDPTCGGAMVTVAAGESWDGLVATAVERGWAGVEALSGIPGLVGATPIQNVGAYGQDVSQTIARVRVWDRVLKGFRTFANADCRFGYRTSRFKADPGRHVVVDVTFQLRTGTLSEPIAYAELARTLGVEVGERAPLADVRAAVLELRRGKGMVLDGDDHDTWSAGSFFTNPVIEPGRVPEGAPSYPQPDGTVKTSAAWLIERAGFGKGHPGSGPATLSTKHTLALTNRGDATTGDLLALAREIRDGVESRFGIRLHNEPVLVGVDL
ncbi:UDP-N-acetylmuramate dehydrogenase [Nocardioides terrae]|uniref:UDP-N-acetylenolpyruvoylglucosamine reductase n=1 Tax=Nocardioides terrae TaxID=574651 RepID=A0A1I1KGR5_9ACTN|nr:UDP-N-acetylmuramate dehydrogenase [Nocardioides terrae]SFC60007.1 UDP-N-acetylmuramate dehydrogenase [Nocardioides terrae]